MRTTNYLRGAAAILVSTGVLTGCPSQQGPHPPPGVDNAVAPPPPVSPDAFVAQINKDIIELNREGNAAGWTQATDITVDTQYLNARTTDRYLEYVSRKAGEAIANTAWSVVTPPR